MVNNSAPEEQGGILTNHQVRIEFLGDGHHHFLEGEHVVTIAHTLIGPWNIDISKKRETLVISCT
jgi:hypothetical protein